MIFSLNYRTEDEIRKGLDRLVTASHFERDANGNYQPTGVGLMHGVMRRQLPQPYHGVAVSLVKEWQDRWEN